jgi:hypothetical protein
LVCSRFLFVSLFVFVFALCIALYMALLVLLFIWLCSFARLLLCSFARLLVCSFARLLVYCSLWFHLSIPFLFLKNTEAPGTTEFSGMTSLLIFYYVTLGFFVCVCVFVLFNFVVRANLELQILSGRRRLKELLSSSWCFAYSLHYSLYTAIILLIGEFESGLYLSVI